MTKRAAEQGSELVAPPARLRPPPDSSSRSRSTSRALRDAVADLLAHTLGGLVELDWQLGDGRCGTPSPTRRSSSWR